MKQKWMVKGSNNLAIETCPMNNNFLKTVKSIITRVTPKPSQPLKGGGNSRKLDLLNSCARVNVVFHLKHATVTECRDLIG